MSSINLRLLHDYILSLEAIRYGYRPRDKLAILVNRILHASFPLNTLWHQKFGKTLLDPRSFLYGYRCRYGKLIFYCPGGNAEIQFLKSWEPTVKTFISSLGSGDAVDVGANLGLYSVILSRGSSLNRRVLSIEPDPTYFRWLRRNIEANRCRNVMLLGIAAWSTSSRLKLTRHIFGGPMTDSSVSSYAKSGYDVDARPLDEVLDEFALKPTFVKIDVEGAEYPVLLGMQRTLRLAKPTLIFEALNNESLEQCSSLLRQHGYDISPLDDGNFLAVYPRA